MQPQRVSILGSETIVVGRGLEDTLARDVVGSLAVSSFVVVTDSNIVAVGLAKPIVDALTRAIADLKRTCRVLTFVVPPGEAAKTRQTKERIEDFCLDNKCTRDTCFVALGGGVIGDMVGFVAATYMRGVPIIQVPTTLLAMVDSSVGGKTAVDVPAGKNLIGRFHQPFRVYIDIAYLRTLPPRQFINGLAEIIKTAAIWSESDFDLLERSSERVLSIAESKSVSEEDEELLIKLILGSVRVKAHVVSQDEKEGDLRGLLNFGHSIGHACEAILTPQVLHGEAVSIGMVLEAQLARYLGKINDSAVGRLTRCLISYRLPISPYDKIVQTLAPGKICKVDEVMEIMKVDKKNQGTTKRIVLLSKIGNTYEKKASAVNDADIRMVLSYSAYVHKLDIAKVASRPPISLAVPGSKSISNRALVMAALGSGECRLKGLLQSDDVQVMLDGLRALLGISYTWLDDGEILVISGANGKCKIPSNDIYLGNAGTAARFLTTVCVLVDKKNNSDLATLNGKTSTIITGNARMKERPIGPLVDALTSNGVSIKYLESKGSLPLQIQEGGLPGGVINLSATVSSQYVSSILISAPYAKTPVTLSLGTDKVISQPYIDMTIAMMKTFGIEVTREPGTNVYRIPMGCYKNPAEYLIEADASSSTYPLAFAAITGSEITVTNIGSVSLQGDAEFAVKVLRPMGCHVSQTETTTTVKGPKRLKALELIDMETMTDAFLTASVLAAVAEGTTSIVGIANQRVKECNRIAAMVEQLALYGVHSSELEDGIKITGKEIASLKVPIDGTKCYDDHRIAMSFALLALLVGAVIKEKACTQKTWPGWWDVVHLKLGVPLEGSSLGFDHVEASLKIKATSKFKSNIRVKPIRESNSCPIILIGMRGAGKTNLGQLFAGHLKRKFIDMDHYMENYLVASGKGTIKEFVHSQGWAAFREFELSSLEKLLASQDTDSSDSAVVISCGGGIVETEKARNTLKARTEAYANGSKNGAIVIHIRRNPKDVIDYLNSDVTRPAYGESVEDVWNRRKGWYDECSQFEFIAVHHRDVGVSWSKVAVDAKRFIDFIVGNPSSTSLQAVETIYKKYDQVLSQKKKPATASTVSTFLCPPFKDIHELIPHLDIVTECCDAIELRVDILSCNKDIDAVGEQLFLLRRFTTLPIIFTVRTVGQAGTYPDAAEHQEHRKRLLKSAVRWGVEFVDVEFDSSILPAISSVAANTNTSVLGSYHNKSGLAIWDESQARAMGSGAQKQTYGRGPRSKRFLDIFVELYNHCDIIKLIGNALTVDDNFALRKFVTEVTETFAGSGMKPLIALNMGSCGKISRVLNDFLTPVTHELFESIAVAPGQISVREIHQVRASLLGMFDQRDFYLFGSPIAHSPSPDLHNYCLKQAGLNSKYVYKLCETESVAEVYRLAKESPNFGGASVTIPLKQAVMTQEAGILDSVTDAVRHIGAVNTLINLGTKTDATGKSTNIILGDNTDYLGIVETAQKNLAILNAPNEAPLLGVVLGAGGTSRAALYALRTMGSKLAVVVNRTLSKAQEVATQATEKGIFEVLACETIGAAAERLAKHCGVAVVIATVPTAAQTEKLIEDVDKAVFEPAGARKTPFPTGGVLVELAYKPAETPLVIAARRRGLHVGLGHEVLTSQGRYAFKKWTSIFAPGESAARVVADRALSL